MRSILNALDTAFLALDQRSRGLLNRLDDEGLFSKRIKVDDGSGLLSCAECIVRSAAKVEQTFGGITTRLWDDPFEWTLPEKLGDKRSILQYLDEVAQTRARGMTFIRSDAELAKLIQAPVEMKTLHEVLTTCSDYAHERLDRAEAASQTTCASQPAWDWALIRVRATDPTKSE
ncbi:MAG TPA: hypothetical protein VNA17_02345 [Pyrinomonadaceae bacterium]|nr:hypothetical protein [Pyrinomonadaceae bacterium]